MQSEILTLEQAVSMTRYSLGWARLHCHDKDFPKMFYVYDARRKYLDKSEWLSYCKKHEIEILEGEKQG